MFRKSVFIMVFVCLLATISPVAMAVEYGGNYPWNGQLEWRAGTDANWYTATNWNNQGTPICPTDGTGPGPDNYCAVLPNQPGPRLGTDGQPNATCSMLSLNAWDPTSWGGQDCNVTVVAGAGDINMGACIQINSWTDYDSYLGTNYLASRAIFNVYGGTVHTLLNPEDNTTNMCGVRIGGGSSRLALAYGMLNIYGGEVNVPKVELNYGEIGLYGGTLHVFTDPNFNVSTTHPEASLNKVKINGGTLILDGNQVDALNTLITGKYIVCERGTLGTPVFTIGIGEPNKTTLTADVNYCAWETTPADLATNIHYKPTGDVCQITLSWSESVLDNPEDVNHDVYFGSTFNLVNTATKLSPAYQGTRYDSPRDPNADPCSWTIKDPNIFLVGRTYYWRIDETNNLNVNKKGLIWRFSVHDGKAYNPKPASSLTKSGLDASFTLSWTAGDWADSHRVYFSTAQPVSTIMTDPLVYRGTQPGTTLDLRTLAPTYTLEPGKTYYWRIVEVNSTYGAIADSVTWTFIPDTYLNIDDFEGSMSTIDVNANWQVPYTPKSPGAGDNNNCTTLGLTGVAGRVLTRDSAGKYLRYTYNNKNSSESGTGMTFSEAKRPYMGVSFTGGGVMSASLKALEIDYRGYATNSAGPYDNMYVAIEDTDGNVAVYLNPDANAQLVGSWTKWFSNIYDINAIGLPSPVNLQKISGFAIGFGDRCTNYYMGSGTGDGNVMFDNIRLHSATCVPEFGPTADLDEDCIVDICDFDVMATDWLNKAEQFDNLTVTKPKDPIIWYKFNESVLANVSDSGEGDSNNYTGTINAYIAANWKTGGGRDGNNCLYLPPGGGCTVNIPFTAPLNALGFMRDVNHPLPGGGGMSFSVWINADTTSDNMQTSWNGLISIWTGTPSAEALELECPIPWVPTNNWSPGCNFVRKPPGGVITVGTGQRPLGDFGGRWNHWAFVKEPNSMKVYCNGQLAGSRDANGQTGDPNANAYGPFCADPNVNTFRIGARGGNWGMWNGYIDDFQLYDCNLTPAEVLYLAGDGATSIFVPLVSPANLKDDGDPIDQIVNFGDLAIMGQQWHTMILWPPD